MKKQIGLRYRVKEDYGSSSYSKGDILVFSCDDGSPYPYFKNETTGAEFCCHWDRLEPVDTVKENIVKYKIGDKVRIIGRNDGNSFGLALDKCRGEVGIITNVIDLGNHYFIDDNKWRINFKGEWLEPVAKDYPLGTKVRIVRCCNGFDDHVGEIGIVSEPCIGDTPHICTRREGKYFCCADEVEEIIEKPKNTEPRTYKKGDRFRVISAYGDFKKGDIVTLDEDPEDNIPAFVGLNDSTEYMGINGNAVIKEVEYIGDSYPQATKVVDNVSLDFGNPDGYKSTITALKYNPRSLTIEWSTDEYEATRKVDPIKSEGVKRMQKFKVGDKAEVIGGTEYNSGHIKHYYALGTIVQIKYLESEKACCVSCDDEKKDQSVSLVDLRPITKKSASGIMKKLSTIARKFLDADTKILVEVGDLDSELEPTEMGKDFALAHYIKTNMKLLADERRAEIKEEAKKEDK